MARSGREAYAAAGTGCRGGYGLPPEPDQAGLYVAPHVGALYYVKSPQGASNDPILIGDREYDNDRHKVFDTYFIPTLSIGYSW